MKLFWLVAGLLALAPFPLKAAVVEQVVVAIEGEPYTLSGLKTYAQTKMGRKFPKGNLNQLEQEDKEVLEQFITEKLVDLEVKRLGITPSNEAVDQYIEDIKKRNQISDEDLTEALRREGMTREQYRNSVRTELEKNEIIHRQVREKVNITDDDIERYYKQNPKKFLTREKLHLRQILLALPKNPEAGQENEVVQKALELRRRLVAGEDFATLAKSYSEGAGADQGGDLGWFNRGGLLSEIEDAAAKLSVGEISQPVRSSLGVHLIKLEGKQGGDPQPLAEVAGKIKDELYAKTMEERFHKWLKTDLRRKYRVDVKLAGVVFRPEDNKEATLSALMASSSRKSKQERTFLSYLNPFSYILKETPIEDDPGEESEAKIVSILGVPLFRKDDYGDLPPDPFVSSEGAKETTESKGFFSTLNPFSSSP